MVTKRPKGLGRGLEALLGPTFDENAATNAANLAAAKAAEQANPGTPSTLMLTDMVAGQYQPRTRMDEGALYELAESHQSPRHHATDLGAALNQRRQRRQIRNHRR